MGILVTKEDENNKLTERINSDLRGKIQTTSNPDAEAKDFAESSEYLKDMAKTSRFSWVWIVLVVLAAISLVVIALI